MASELENLIAGNMDNDEEEEVELTEAEQLQKLKEELDAQKAELEKRSRDLNKGFMEISERERRLQTPAPVEDEDEVDIPPEAAKILDGYIGKKTKPLEEALQSVYVESVGRELDHVAEKTGHDTEEILKVVEQYRLTPRDNSITAAKEVFEAASEIIKAKGVNLDEVKKQIKEEMLKELEKQGVRIEGVAPARELPAENLDEETMTPGQKYALFRSRQK